MKARRAALAATDAIVVLDIPLLVRQDGSLGQKEWADLAGIVRGRLRSRCRRRPPGRAPGLRPGRRRGPDRRAGDPGAARRRCRSDHRQQRGSRRARDATRRVLAVDVCAAAASDGGDDAVRVGESTGAKAPSQGRSSVVAMERSDGVPFVMSQPSSSPPAISRTPSRRWRPGSSAATGSRRCSASPGRARAPPSPGPSSRSSGPRWCIAPNKSLAAQLANELREFFPAQPGRVLRQLLRLLPARGVHALERHLHREGLLGQRRDRPAAPRLHLGAADPARHHHRGLGVLHLRPRVARGVRDAAARRAHRRGARPARDPAPARRHAVRPQRHEPRAGQRSGSVATSSRCTPRTRRHVVRIELFGDEIERSPSSIRSPASASTRSTSWWSSRPRTT